MSLTAFFISPWWERYLAEERADNFNHSGWRNLFHWVSVLKFSASISKALSGSWVNHLVYAWKWINHLQHQIEDATVAFAFSGIGRLSNTFTLQRHTGKALVMLFDLPRLRIHEEIALGIPITAKEMSPASSSSSLQASLCALIADWWGKQPLLSVLSIRSSYKHYRYATAVTQLDSVSAHKCQWTVFCFIKIMALWPSRDQDGRVFVPPRGT